MTNQMRPEDAMRILKQADANLIKDLVVALDAARTQLQLVGKLLGDLNLESWSGVAHGCNFQVGVVDRALAKAKRAGYDS